MWEINMADKLIATCNTCEREFEVTPNEIMFAVRKRDLTGGMALLGCNLCGRVNILPNDTPTATKDLRTWIAKLEEEEESCCPCLPLTGVVAVEPVGRFEFPPNSGVVLYKPGGAQTDDEYPDGFPRRVYMWKFGLDPDTIWKLMRS